MPGDRLGGAGRARGGCRGGPADDVPLRFFRRVLYEEDFVLVMRARHPFRRDPSLDRYCKAQHLVVSLSAAGRVRAIEYTAPRSRWPFVAGRHRQRGEDQLIGNQL
jgi:DNA-binding transcriptional LysR family regulator